MQKSGVAQSKGVRWGGRKDKQGEGKLKIQKTVDRSGVGFSLDVTLAKKPKFGAVPDRGCNSITL